MAGHKFSVTQLIHEIKQRAPIYNDQMEEYKDNELKAALWADIAQALCNISDSVLVDKMKFKWKNLRDGFTRARREYMKKQTDGVKARLPKYSSEMSFIIPFIRPRRKDYISDGEDDGNDSHDVLNDVDTGDDPLDFEDNKAAVQKKIDIMIGRNPVTADFTDLKDAIDMKNEAVCSSMLPVNVHYDKGEDETEIFFRSIAKTVKRLKPLHQALVKKTIINIVLDVEIREARRLS